jgi:GTP-binding protein
MSAARPKIGDFPFTTLSPVLGIVGHGSEDSFVMADLPGLIEGAHEGRGLGHRFLRHIERTRLLVLLLDLSSDTLREDYLTLLGELESYGRGLDRKPRIVALNKADLATGSIVPKDVIGEERTAVISALTGAGLDELGRLLVSELAGLDE